MKKLIIYGPQFYPKGSLVMDIVRVYMYPCVLPPISKYNHLFFLKFCDKLGINESKKVTQPEFWKKS